MFMQDLITEKNTKENVLLKFIATHKFLSSLILCLIFFLIYLPLNGFHIYTGGDDPGIVRLISNGEIGIGFVGYFFAWFVSIIQPVFYRINLNFYYILHEIICFISLGLINYFILCRLPVKKGLFLSIVFDIVFFSFFIITIQFTMTAAVCATAGILSMIYGCIYEERKRYKRLHFFGGAFLALLGSQVRFNPFVSLCAVTAAFAFGAFLSDIIKNKKELGFKNSLIKTFKSFIKPAVAIILTAVIIFGANMLSESMKYTDPNYEDFLGYNESLSKVNDYRSANFFANKDFYRSIDIKSFAEINILKRWCVDDDFFTKEKLDAISDYSAEHAYDGAGSKSSLKVLITRIGEGLSDHVKSGLIILDVFIAIAVLFTLWILFFISRKKFYIVFPIVLFVSMWGILLLTTGGLTASADNCNLLILPISIFTIYVAIFYNKHQQIITFFLSLAVIALYIYLYLSRIHFTASLCFYLPTYVFMLFSLNEENRKEINFKKHPMLLKRIAAAALVITAISSGALLFMKVTYVEYPEEYEKVQKYIKSHKDNTFLKDGIYRDKSNFNALVESDEPKNIISFGGWDKHSKTYKNSLKSRGINHLFKDTVDSDIIVVLFNYSGKPDVLNGKVGDFQIYYNDHYAPKGKVISLKKIKDFNRYTMYKIVSEKTDNKKQQ